MFAEQNRAFEVRVQAGVPLFFAHLGQRFRQHDAGIAHDDVQPAPLADGALHQRTNVRVATDVAGQLCDSPAAKGFVVFVAWLVVAGEDTGSMLRKQNAR